MAEREKDASTSPPSAVQPAPDVANSPPSASESPEAAGSGWVRLVHVEIAGARKLLPKDGASSSPFCVVEFNGHTKRTHTVERDLNPVWDEKFVFAVPLPSPLNPSLADHQEPVHVTIYTLSSASAPLVAAGSISASFRRPVLGSAPSGGLAGDPERSVFLGKVQGGARGERAGEEGGVEAGCAAWSTCARSAYMPPRQGIPLHPLHPSPGCLLSAAPLSTASAWATWGEMGEGGGEGGGGGGWRGGG
ncbi:unnamed protein product [Closterium sp. Naga37s-1]|nr:unnamed protein product [Closterium sp. Naga37s-1]